MANFMTDVIFGPLAHSMTVYEEAGSSEDMLAEISDETIDSMLADLPEDVASQVYDELPQHSRGDMTNGMDGTLDQEQEPPTGMIENLPYNTDIVTQGVHTMALQTPARPLTSVPPMFTTADASHNWIHHSSHIFSSSLDHFFGCTVSYNPSLRQLRYRALVEPNIEVSHCEIIEDIPTASNHINHDHEIHNPHGA
jgi:hypothetical protein